MNDNVIQTIIININFQATSQNVPKVILKLLIISTHVSILPYI